MSNFAPMKKIRGFVLLLLICGCISAVLACTSAIIGGEASASGRILLWKHRDTGTEHSFVARVAPPAGEAGMAYIALFNGGDSLLLEAWTGVNEAGFAVMNTASYNLAPDTARLRDQEGIVMARALRVCRDVASFDSILRCMPRPLGVQANFGCADASGHAAYFETCDTGFVRIDLLRPDTMIVRTNYSHSGVDDGGLGYIREASAEPLLAPMVRRGDVAPHAIFDSVSCSFYHSLLGYDAFAAADSSDRWLVDQDFIPRYSTGASVIIELPAPGDAPDSAVMWTALGYPPCSGLYKASLDSICEGLLPHGKLWHAPLCDEAVVRKREIFPIERGSGMHYIYLPALRKYMNHPNHNCLNKLY